MSGYQSEETSNSSKDELLHPPLNLLPKSLHNALLEPVLIVAKGDPHPPSKRIIEQQHRPRTLSAPSGQGMQRDPNGGFIRRVEVAKEGEANEGG